MGEQHSHAGWCGQRYGALVSVPVVVDIGQVPMADSDALRQYSTAVASAAPVDLASLRERSVSLDREASAIQTRAVLEVLETV